jgi:SAM-dependent methyltransferase
LSSKLSDNSNFVKKMLSNKDIMLKLYSDLATWWPLLSPLEDYADEAAFFEKVLTDAGLPPSPSLLELGCGGGSNAFYLKKAFAHVTLTDLSADMLAISRALNPECEHIVGDMRSLRLGRTFDVVFIHDAIEYMTSASDLGRAMETAFIHCKPGGLALFVPDQVRETFQPSTEHAGKDGDGRALRYMEWSYDPDVSDTTYTVEYVVLLREGAGPARVVHEQHICGLFPRTVWLSLLQAAGFEPTIFHDQYDRDIFLARKPKGSG